MIGVGASELSTEVVKAHAVLGATGFEAELVGERVEPKVLPAQLAARKLGPQRTTHHSPVAAPGEHVDAIIRSPLETVQKALHVQQF
jgi:hypothetical protein